MKPKELQTLALDRHKQKADEWYNYVLRSIESQAGNGYFEWTSWEFKGNGSFVKYGKNNKKEVDRVINQLKSLGLDVKIDKENISISWEL